MMDFVSFFSRRIVSLYYLVLVYGLFVVRAVALTPNSCLEPLAKRENSGTSIFIIFVIIITPLLLLSFAIYGLYKSYETSANAEITRTIIQFQPLNTLGGTYVDPGEKAHLTAEELASYPVFTLYEVIASKVAAALKPEPEPEPEPEPHPMKPSTLPPSQSPSAPVSASEPPTLVLTTEQGIKSFECSCCLEKIFQTDSIRLIPCLHLFHLRCIDSWLIKFSTSCPSCRFNLSRDSA